MQLARNNWPALVANENSQRRTIAIVLLAPISFFFALALFLAVRRALGAMTSPLAPLPLVATALVMLAWIYFARAVSRSPISGPADSPESVPRSVIRQLPAMTLLLMAFACSAPGARAIDWLVWIPTFAAAWFGSRIVGPASNGAREQRDAQSRILSPVADEPDEHILQQLTRFRTAGGCDALRGTLTAEFAPGQRTATLFVGFCPPFERLPTVEAEIDDAELAAVKLVQVLHNGAQLEVRLPEPTAAGTIVVVQLFAAETEPS